MSRITLAVLVALCLCTVGYSQFSQDDQLQLEPVSTTPLKKGDAAIVIVESSRRHPAVVTEIDSDGNLILSGQSKLYKDGQEIVVKLSGKVNAKRLPEGNEINSDTIENLRIESRVVTDAPSAPTEEQLEQQWMEVEKEQRAATAKLMILKAQIEILRLQKQLLPPPAEHLEQAKTEKAESAPHLQQLKSQQRELLLKLPQDPQGTAVDAAPNWHKQWKEAAEQGGSAIQRLLEKRPQTTAFVNAPPAKWEYNSIRGVNPTNEHYNELGEQGWELVSFVIRDNGSSVAIFKRAKQ